MLLLLLLVTHRFWPENLAIAVQVSGAAVALVVEGLKLPQLHPSMCILLRHASSISSIIALHPIIPSRSNFSGSFSSCKYSRSSTRHFSSSSRMTAYSSLPVLRHLYLELSRHQQQQQQQHQHQQQHHHHHHQQQPLHRPLLDRPQHRHLRDSRLTKR